MSSRGARQGAALAEPAAEPSRVCEHLNQTWVLLKGSSTTNMPDKRKIEGCASIWVEQQHDIASLWHSISITMWTTPALRHLSAPGDDKHWCNHPAECGQEKHRGVPEEAGTMARTQLVAMVCQVTT